MSLSTISSKTKRLLPERIKRAIKNAWGVRDTDACLSHLKRCGFSPNVAIDVGAFSGDWTRSVLRSFPNIRVLMVEPQEEKKKELESMLLTNSSLELATVLLGSRPSDGVEFHENGTASSVLRDTNNNNSRSKTIAMTTLDILIRQKRFPEPNMIKLDVQGYEIEVLQGASQALSNAEVVLAEVNLIPIYNDAPLAHHAIRFMADHGFHVYDFGAFFRRPYDGALWQVDVFFVRSSSALLSSTRWC